MGRFRTDAPLARTSAAELDLARAHRDALLRSAAVLVRAASHDPDAAPCSAAGCHLAALGSLGTELCAIAHRLADLPDAPTAPAPAPVHEATDGFVAALRDAADAVRTCRQTAHANPGCWFSSAPGVDGCVDVLRLLHRTG